MGGAGSCLLGLRLYLPRNWLRDVDRLDATGVPEEYRLPQTRGSIALDLLDAARADGWLAETVFVSSGLENDSGLREGLEQRGLRSWTEEEIPGTPHGDQQAMSRAQVEEACRVLVAGLGLDHFEGRSWRGFHHHACLVALACSFRNLQPSCLKHSTL